ncbi:hypothetical protein BpHYR1_048596 [Brachionus plicatilis]|uniref:Uncharacterized protein n=1 Tax=Brachionus plicatilis TaxID=10195 RepID=A0A3M7QQ95_BRAPC|nr:hypothetical protein BpHYR1_048596 [Brachionus plicatilis]
MNLNFLLNSDAKIPISCTMFSIKKFCKLFCTSIAYSLNLHIGFLSSQNILGLQEWKQKGPVFKTS